MELKLSTKNHRSIDIQQKNYLDNKCSISREIEHSYFNLLLPVQCVQKCDRFVALRGLNRVIFG